MLREHLSFAAPNASRTTTRRYAGCLLVTMIALCGPVRAQEAGPAKKDAAVGAEEAADPSTPRGHLLNKLNTIKMPVVSFENTSIGEAIDFFRMRSTELDKAEPDPARKGINVVIRKPPGAEEKRLTMNLKDVTLRRILDEIARQSGLRCKVDDHAVVLVPADEKDPPELTREPAEAAAKDRPPVGPKATGNMKLLRTTMLPIVDFENVSLADAVTFLNARAKELSGAAADGIIKIRPNTNGDSRIERLSLRNVPLFDVAKYCAEAVNEKISVDDDGLQIGK
jgi:bla regulator protein BlaR1